MFFSPFFLQNFTFLTIEMKGITRCKLTIISESAFCKNFLGQIWSYTVSLYISNGHSLECYVVI
jgi:hypothetical protein